MYNQKRPDQKRGAPRGQGIRIAIMTIMALAMSVVLIQRLFTLQIINGEDYLNNFALSIKKTRTLPSTRGEIYDCNGELLAYNQLSYVVTFENSGSYPSTHIQNLTLNSILYRTIKMLESHGDHMTSDFRVRLADDGSWEYTTTGFKLSRFKADLFGPERRIRHDRGRDFRPL